LGHYIYGFSWLAIDIVHHCILPMLNLPTALIESPKLTLVSCQEIESRIEIPHWRISDYRFK
jgi:hypothetical protein